MPSLYYETDNVIEIPSLTDGIDGSYVNTATVQATLYDQDEVEITGQTWPLSMAYVAASNGTYRGTILDTINVSPGDLVRCVVTATDGADRKRTWTADYYVIRG